MLLFEGRYRFQILCAYAHCFCVITEMDLEKKYIEKVDLTAENE